jgi:hypothetical protein
MMVYHLLKQAQTIASVITKKSLSSLTPVLNTTFIRTKTFLIMVHLLPHSNISYTHTLSLSLSLSLAHTPSLSLSLAHTPSLLLSLAHTPYLSLSLAHTHTLTHTHTHTHIHSITIKGRQKTPLHSESPPLPPPLLLHVSPLPELRCRGWGLEVEFRSQLVQRFLPVFLVVHIEQVFPVAAIANRPPEMRVEVFLEVPAEKRTQ